MSSTRLQLNGRPVDVPLPPEMPLLWVLRDHLGLMGTKYGCGQGACGACTVHVNGQPQRACQTPLQSLANARVTTVEGLHADGRHAVQQAWNELDVPQCGYCQSGQLMAAAALIRRHPQPTDAQIDEALAGHLCRCGTYVRIRAAVHRAAEIARGQA